MAIDTTYGEDLLLLGEQVVLGTCEVGNAFGSVESASVKRTADKEQIENCMGGLLAFLLTNPRFELSLETIFTATVTPPGLMEAITFPLVGVAGVITNIEIVWEKKGARKLKIEASSWDSLDGATAYRYTGSTQTFTELE